MPGSWSCPASRTSGRRRRLSVPWADFEETLMRNAEITGWGKCMPPNVLSNHDLEQLVDTSDEWITTRTGIKERRVAAADQACSDLALAAGRAALEMAGTGPKDLDGIIIGTVTGDMQFPA